MLSKLIPEKISLSNVANDLSTQEIIIKGYAQTRDDLIAFNKNLEASQLFKEVKIPLSNFLTQEAIIFEITAKVNNIY